ncbi:hypothetical protein PV11_09639 [Exophiala sideris]|uniref:Reverse transcriptase domain-containing protein n=1 Tax=Exophiala sideris TaxID=1016849 RepID=A0A0D1WS03_9EURO|nr:hypothetical protein PV11_09639 [Exophiala sideris]
MVQNYRKPNEVTTKKRYILCAVEPTFNELAIKNSKFKSQAVGRSGYWGFGTYEQTSSLLLSAGPLGHVASVPSTDGAYAIYARYMNIMSGSPFSGTVHIGSMGLLQVRQFSPNMEDFLRPSLWDVVLLYIDDIVVYGRTRGSLRTT